MECGNFFNSPFFIAKFKMFSGREYYDYVTVSIFVNIR